MAVTLSRTVTVQPSAPLLRNLPIEQSSIFPSVYVPLRSALNVPGRLAPFGEGQILSRLNLRVLMGTVTQNILMLFPATSRFRAYYSRFNIPRGVFYAWCRAEVTANPSWETPKCIKYFMPSLNFCIIQAVIYNIYLFTTQVRSAYRKHRTNRWATKN